MFDRIKNRLRKAEDKLDAIGVAQAEQFALTRLQQLFPSGFFPALTTWSISPSTMLYVCNEIAVSGAKSVVEFGSGYSTFCIAALIKNNFPDVHFISVESDAAWMQSVHQSLLRLGCRENATLIHAPISDLPEKYAHTHPQKWYDSAVVLAAVQKAPPVDLLLVDGPFGKISPFARYPAVPVLMSSLAANYSVYLDDSNREQESEIAGRWAELLGCKRKDHHRFTCLRKGEGFEPTPYGF
jgi:protein-L-isoaspartate O-methyltransferase